MQQGTGQRVATALAQVWERSRPSVLARLAVLEAAAAAMEQGEYPDELRQAAAREVHKLIGSLGTFGHGTGSRLAREIQPFFADGARSPEGVGDLRTLLRQLQEVLEQPPVTLTETGAVAGGAEPVSDLHLLISGHDADVVDQLVGEAGRWGLRCTVVESLGRAGASHEPADGAVLFWSPEDEEEREQISRLAAQIPVVVLVPNATFAVRLAVARMGARGCFASPAPALQVIEKVQQGLLRHRAPTGTVLVVDDDPTILAVVAALLQEIGLSPVALENPARFWELLEESNPDLVILDVEMPGLSGIDLCQVMRNDHRWSTVPVLFLTAHSDSATIHRIFSSGADDYVSKPVVGPELINRIGNRLERTQLHRHMAETDVLTGVSNRRKSAQQLDHYLRLSARHQLPLSLVVLDLDRFKQVNDRWGHATGDQVLHRLGEVLTSACRGEDVVGRWGGEEFVLGMYGVYKERAAVRVQHLLDRFAAEQFTSPNGERFQISFSAGVAQAPGDADDLAALYRAADAALYRAKEAGRARVQMA